MPIEYTDDEITKLLAERKPVLKEDLDRIVPKAKRAGLFERELTIVGDGGNYFVIKVRQSSVNPFDFSVIVCVRMKSSQTLFRLRRYNGKSHEHTNKLEGTPAFYDFHIHQATERYQEAEGMTEESFAEKTRKYSDVMGAIAIMVTECGIELPSNQGDLFSKM
jgi:hypothetical protein